MKKPTRAERIARAAEDELPYAAQSGLTTSLIAGAQPQNALVDRRIYQPSLASMEAMNPDPRLGRSGFINAMQDVYADPGRMLPGSGGWTEGVGAALPHLGAAALDLVNPAGMAGRAGRAAPMVVESGNSLSKMRLPAPQYRHPTVLPQGPINPHFAPTGEVGNLQHHAVQLGKVPPPRFDSAHHNAGVSLFQKAIMQGDFASVREMYAREGRRFERRYNSSPETDALYLYMSKVLDVPPPTMTRHAPGGQLNRSSNSNAPTIGGGAQPDPFAPTLSPRRPQ